jgi:hypothetical protein
VNWNVLERKLKNDNCKLLSFGGASRDRTDDLIVANDALSQLSYSPLTAGSFSFLDFSSRRSISPMPVPIEQGVQKMEGYNWLWDLRK